ncbi:MAG TPA: type II toxin-antitoxin system prevent-host-death family antitoxin [Atopobiaceae bacterium]|nr:type II toxin-antitoxin system prevent-host-death family antitoxin [Atopobiaceae bacterium]
MPVCVPIKDMRDTARFSELVETSAGPVIVTKNGYSKFVVMRSEDYDALEMERARAKLMARIAVAERERSSGLGIDAFAALDAIEDKYGL